MRIEAGQVAVVTGAASGIGHGLAEVLAARGVNVMLTDVRAEALPAALESLSGLPGEVAALRTDVTVAADLVALSDATLERFGRVDIVCNNAGVICDLKPSWEQELQSWRWLVDVKLMGVVHGLRAFAPILISQGSGHFLNTASVGGMAPLPMLTPYNAAMHAVIGLTETLNLELRSVSDQLGATVFCPGLVATSLGSNSAALLPPGAATTQGDPGSVGDIAMSPTEAAEFAIAAVEAGRVHAVVGAGAAEMARNGIDGLLRDL